MFSLVNINDYPMMSSSVQYLSTLPMTTESVPTTPGNRNRSPDDLKRKGPPRRAILLSSQCSGSSWLASSLNAMKGVKWAGETMGPKYRLSDNRRDPLWRTVSWETYRDDLDKAFPIHTKSTVAAEEKEESTGLQLVGFKLMYDHIPQHLYREFAEWLNREDIHVVHLRRRCAALQFASQVQKFQRVSILKEFSDYYTNQTKIDNLPDVWKLNLNEKQWKDHIKTLEENQDRFSNFLYVNAALAPTIEVSYEMLDGPHRINWLNAIAGFLGLEERMTGKESNVLKVGGRRCEDRMDGLSGMSANKNDGNPVVSSSMFYDQMMGLNSRRECLMLANIALSSSAGSSNFTSSAVHQIVEEFLPPQDGQCLVEPGCRQGEYMQYACDQKHSGKKDKVYTSLCSKT